MSNNEVKTNSSGHQKGSSIMASTVIPVTDVYMRPIIGSKGKTIKSIKEKYNVRIRTLDKKPEEGHLHPCVRITGNHDNVDKAARWIGVLLPTLIRKNKG